MRHEVTGHGRKLSPAKRGELLSDRSRLAAASAQHRTLEFADEVILLDQKRGDAISANKGHEVISGWHSRVNAAVNQLTEHLIKSYNGDVSIDDVRGIMLRFKQNAGLSLDHIIKTFEPRLLPVVVLREICARHRVMFDAAACPSFQTFMQRYHAVISPA